MKFNPCVAGQCATEGAHSEGCGRIHAEMAEISSLREQ